MKNYKGRKVAIIALFGSHNYGTNDETSDKDYKMYLVPTIEDLYEGNKFKEAVKIDGNDYDIKDIRDLPSLIFKSNPAYLEILNSKEVIVNEIAKDLWNWMHENRFKLAEMNKLGLYNTLTGMVLQKRKWIEKDLPKSETNEGYKRRIKYGFETKNLLHSERLMAMRDEIFNNGVNYLDTIDLKHPNLSGMSEKLLKIKRNEINYTKEDALNRIDELLSHKNTNINYKVNKKLNEEFKDQVKKFVLNEVHNSN